MKKSLLGRIGAGFLMGSVLVVVPLGSAWAADHDLYDSLKELSDGIAAHRTGGDVYESMEPSSYGAQGPMRSDMMKDSDSAYSSTYPSTWSQWDELRMRLGPIGGEGSN